jgi:hypothetical protein
MFMLWNIQPRIKPLMLNIRIWFVCFTDPFIKGLPPFFFKRVQWGGARWIFIKEKGKKPEFDPDGIRTLVARCATACQATRLQPSSPPIFYDYVADMVFRKPFNSRNYGHLNKPTPIKYYVLHFKVKWYTICHFIAHFHTIFWYINFIKSGVYDIC